MDELAKAGGNHPKNEEENTYKKEEDTNTVQVDLLMRTNTVQAVLLVRTRKVYPKKPRIKKTRGIDSGSAVQRTTKKKGST